MKTYTPRPREWAQEQIEAYILEHGLRADDCLPPEREMCRMWNLNRCTLRSALAGLEASGRLYAVQGSGTRIAPRFRRTLQDLQSFTEYAAESGFHAETRLLSFATIECDKTLSRRFHRMLGEKLYRISRLRILEQLPLMIETAYIPVALAPGLEEQDLVTESLFRILKSIYGLSLDHGVEKTGITLVSEEEAQYLQLTAGDAAFWIESRTEASDGTVVEYCRTVGRADRIEMVSTLHWTDAEESRI